MFLLQENLILMKEVGNWTEMHTYWNHFLQNTKLVENTRYPLMKRHISSQFFSKFDDFLSFVIYIVQWSLSKKIAFSTDIEHKLITETVRELIRN